MGRPGPSLGSATAVLTLLTHNPWSTYELGNVKKTSSILHWVSLSFYVTVSNLDLSEEIHLNVIAILSGSEDFLVYTDIFRAFYT